MKIELDYGRSGLSVDLPEDNLTVIQPTFVPGLPNEEEALRQGLRNPIGTKPLRELVKPSDTVAIVFSDKTRAMPRERVLPILLSELDYVPSDQIVLINGLGMHEPNSEAELIEMLGEQIVRRYRIVSHDPFDKNKLVCVGTSRRGNEAWVSREYMNASVRILTGFIEPHLFAGFSGGPKAVLPAVSAEGTILRNHGGPMIGDPNSKWGITTGNPIYEDMLEIAEMTKPTFLLNVTLNRPRQITGVFAGDLRAAHAEGTNFARRTAMQKVSQPFDIVVTTNSGYPLDLNLYQAIKGVSAAAQIVKPGGAIVAASECCDGVPDYGNYKKILKMAKTPPELLGIVSSPDFSLFDQWEAHVQVMIQQKARVILKCSGLSDDEVRDALLEPCHSIAETVAELVKEYGPQAKIAVMPEGPQTIPYLAG
jgi:lactate racemase